MHKAATSWKRGGGQRGQTLSTWEDAQGALAGGEELSERVSVTCPGLRESDGILRGEELIVSLSPTQPQALGVAGVLRGPTAPLKGTLPPTSLMPRTCQLTYTV